MENLNRAGKVGGGVFSLQFLFMDTRRLAVAYLRNAGQERQEFKPSIRHYQIVTKFLTGETNISVSKILELWMKSPYGLPPESHEERSMLFSTKIEYQSISENEGMSRICGNLSEC